MKICVSCQYTKFGFKKCTLVTFYFQSYLPTASHFLCMQFDRSWGYSWQIPGSLTIVSNMHK